MLELRDVSKTYRTGTFGGAELAAVRGVSFAVSPGEVVSLVGESGSGKSTIGRMILRLVAVTGGTILHGGTPIATLPRRRLKRYYGAVQGVFQDPFSSYNPIFRTEHVFSMIREEYFPREGRSAWQERLAGSLESVGLDPAVLARYPHELSGGQLQRLLIARALLLDIDFLVADEVISMLDASTRIDVLNLLGDLKGRGVGILFITHDLALGSYISDRTVILRRGAVVELGPTAAVYGDPRHPYTQALLEAVPSLHERWSDAGPARAAAADAPRPPHAPPLVEVAPGHLVADGE